MLKKQNIYRAAAALILLLCLTLSYSEVSYSQTGLTDTDLTRLRASDISDTQLRTFLDRAEQEGVSINQAFQLARQRGLPSSVESELRARISGLQRATDPVREEVQQFREEDDEVFDLFIRPPREETETMKRTFGSQIFRTQHTEFSPTRNLPTPVSYTLGAGDELVVNIWGDQTNTYRFVVTNEGTVDIDNLGPVFVNGLNIQEANDRIINQLRQNYSGLRPGSDNQTTYARVSLDRLRSIQVALVGEISNPGDYTISGNSTIFNALYRAGGPAENGSYRSVRVIREDEVIADLDLYDFLVDGIQRHNIRLRDMDVIHVGTYKNRVEVLGEVKRDSLYFEVKDGETISDLVRYAGGFTENAFTDQIRIYRNTSTERRILTVSKDQFDDTEVRSGDILFIDEILERFENRVSITGAVWRSGEFELREGMTLYELIDEASGVRPDAFMSRGIINRLRPDFTFEQVSFSLSGILNEPEIHDIELRPEDHVLVRSIHNMADEQTVHINGAVRNSGTFPYRFNMTLEDLIVKADGFSDSASEARIEISRRIVGEAAPERRRDSLAEVFTFSVERDLQLSEEDAQFIIEPFDRVYIHRRPDYAEQMTITIEGEVMYPGSYTISSRNERISDIIQRAGGLTPEAYIPGSRLVRQITSIDRPLIRLDFLTGQDIVDEETLGFGMFREIEPDSESDRRTREEYDDNERDILRNRTDLNRIAQIETERARELSDEERMQRERRIGIDLTHILKNPGSDEDLYVREGDVIRIPQELQTVAISGAVMQDVEVRFRPGQNLGYYIDRAGGYAENARSGRAYVVFANGDVDRRKRYIFGLIRSSPEIEPGAQIIVPAKPERTRMSTGEVISISSAVVGMSTSIIIAIDRLSR